MNILKNKRGMALIMVVVSMTVVFVLLSMILSLSVINSSTLNRAVLNQEKINEVNQIGYDYISLKGNFLQFYQNKGFEISGNMATNASYKIEYSTLKLKVQSILDKDLLVVELNGSGEVILWRIY